MQLGPHPNSSSNFVQTSRRYRQLPPVGPEFPEYIHAAALILKRGYHAINRTIVDRCSTHRHMLLSRNSKVPPRQHVPFSSQGTPSSSLLAAIEHYPKILGYCVALASGILRYGYDLLIVGNVSAMPEFQ